MTANINWQKSHSVLGSRRGSAGGASGSGWIAPGEGQPSLETVLALELGVYLQFPLEIKAADEVIGEEGAAPASLAVGPHTHECAEPKRRG